MLVRLHIVINGKPSFVLTNQQTLFNIQGVSVNTFDLKNESYPFIYGRNAPNISGGYNSSISRYQNLILLSSNNFTITLSEFQYFILTLSLHRLCLENSLDENLVKGKIVLCDGFQGPSSLGLVSGAAGILLRSSVPKDVAFIYALPAVVIGLVDGAIIQSYINLSRYILPYFFCHMYHMIV